MNSPVAKSSAPRARLLLGFVGVAIIATFPLTTAVGALVVPRLAAVVPLTIGSSLALVTQRPGTIASEGRRRLRSTVVCLVLVSLAAVLVSPHKEPLDAAINLWPVAFLLAVAGQAARAGSRRLAAAFYFSLSLLAANIFVGLLLGGISFA